MKAGVSPSTAYRAEKDNPKTEWETYVALAGALGLEIDWAANKVIPPKNMTADMIRSLAGTSDRDGQGNDPALSIVEFALKHGISPDAITRASKLVKQAASQSPPAQGKSDKKRGSK